jgi:hypothetical protein
VAETSIPIGHRHRRGRELFVCELAAAFKTRIDKVSGMWNLSDKSLFVARGVLRPLRVSKEDGRSLALISWAKSI